MTLKMNKIFALITLIVIYSVGNASTAEYGRFGINGVFQKYLELSEDPPQLVLPVFHYTENHFIQNRTHIAGQFVPPNNVDIFELITTKDFNEKAFKNNITTTEFINRCTLPTNQNGHGQSFTFCVEFYIDHLVG